MIQLELTNILTIFVLHLFFHYRPPVRPVNALCHICLSVCTVGALTFESLDLEISLLAFSFTISRSRSSIKVMGSRSRSYERLSRHHTRMVWLSLKGLPLPCATQHPSYGDCLEVKREYYQNSSVPGLCDTMFTVSSTLI